VTLDLTGVDDAPATSQEERSRVLADPGFGLHFTDHMVSSSWDATAGWHETRLERLRPLTLHPATSVLHYGQAVIEGLKAYRHEDGSVWAFRPEQNAARLQRSCRRIALPELPVEVFLEALESLVSVDRDWVPSGGESSLYLRPFVFATDPSLANQPSASAEFHLLASPAGDYFAGGVAPISVWVSTAYVRAAPGGTGAAKFAGNYAAGFAAQAEGVRHGCDQVLFLDAVEHRWLEELGGMNVMAVLADGTLVTSPTSGSILEGVTRDSLLQVGSDLGLRVVERPLALEELESGAASGQVAELFACGTAAVVTPIGSLVHGDSVIRFADGGTGPVTARLRRTLLDLQYGRSPDPHAWLHRLV
jgi:branched-chain amino acid aminotransferase